MKELSYFSSFKLLLCVYGVSNEIRKCELRDQIHVLYINILPSKMHLVVITTHW